MSAGIAYVRWLVMPRILDAPPIAAGHGAMEVHVLMPKQRLLETAWALYSFLRCSARPMRVVVHDDGSLDESCRAGLARLFPGVTIIDRAAADRAVISELQQRGLPLLAELRKRLIFALKLIDPFLFGATDSYVILDSDILTFRRPTQLIDGQGHLFSLDHNDYGYSFPPRVLRYLLGRDVIERVCAGLLRVDRGAFSLERLEEHLRATDLLHDPRANFVHTEQTLYGCEMAVEGAACLDPNAYATWWDPHTPQIAMMHYCGGIAWSPQYHSGLHRVANKIGLSGRFARSLAAITGLARVHDPEAPSGRMRPEEIASSREARHFAESWAAWQPQPIPAETTGD